MEINTLNLEKVKKHLADTYRLSDDKIEFMLNGASQSMGSELAKAEMAINENDLETVSRSAHSLKGALRNLGAEQLATLAEEIEHQKVATAEDLRTELEKKLQQMRQGLSPLL